MWLQSKLQSSLPEPQDTLPQSFLLQERTAVQTSVWRWSDGPLVLGDRDRGPECEQLIGLAWPGSLGWSLLR